MRTFVSPRYTLPSFLPISTKLSPQRRPRVDHMGIREAHTSTHCASGTFFPHSAARPLDDCRTLASPRRPKSLVSNAFRLRATARRGERIKSNGRDSDAPHTASAPRALHHRGTPAAHGTRQRREGPYYYFVESLLRVVSELSEHFRSAQHHQRHPLLG